MTAHTVSAGRFRLPVIVVVAAIWLLGLVLVLGNNTVSDEKQHLAQAIGFADGDFDLDDTITVLPGYHAVIAVPLALTDSTSPDIARFTTMVIGLVAVWLFHRATRDNRSNLIGANPRALQWAVLPIAVPYAFLVYTDQLAAVTVLAIWLLLRDGRTEWAGVAAAAAVVVRQTNIVWAVALCALDLIQRAGSIPAAWRMLSRPATLRRYWTFLIPAGMLVAILATQGTVAIGDKDLHRVGVYPENVLFMVMVCGGLFWPVLLGSAAPSATRMRAWVGFGAVAVVVYLAAWDPDHLFNQFGGTRFVRNWLLTNSLDKTAVQALLLVALLFGVFVLSRIELRPGVSYLFFPFAALALIPQELVEQRYYIVPVMFLLIFRQSGPDRAERLLTAWWAFVTVTVMVAMFGLDRIVI